MSCTLALCLALVTVTDGDTIRAGDLRIRLWGIDAPEMNTPAGPPAKAALAALIGGREVACDPLYLDRYGRTVARCEVAGVDLACAMVRQGQARDWPEYSGGAYAGCQAAAE